MMSFSSAGLVGLGIYEFKYAAMIASSYTSLLLYFLSFTFIPTTVSLPSISYSCCSLSL
jgi:hypothetical protein